MSVHQHPVGIKCFGCKETFDGLHDYWEHSNGPECGRTGETWV